MKQILIRARLAAGRRKKRGGMLHPRFDGGGEDLRLARKGETKLSEIGKGLRVARMIGEVKADAKGAIGTAGCQSKRLARR